MDKRKDVQTDNREVISISLLMQATQNLSQLLKLINQTAVSNKVRNDINMDKYGLTDRRKDIQIMRQR